jgi:hypothetical protein
MGAWGEQSFACDDVQDEMEYFRRNKASRTENNLSKALDKIKADDYNPTVLVGVVLELIKMNVKVPQPYIQQAVKDAAAALADNKYMKSWGDRELRHKVLTEEMTQLQSLLR